MWYLKESSLERQRERERSVAFPAQKGVLKSSFVGIKPPSPPVSTSSSSGSGFAALGCVSKPTEACGKAVLTPVGCGHGQNLAAGSGYTNTQPVFFPVLLFL